MSTFNREGWSGHLFFCLDKWKDMIWLKMDNRSNLLKYQEKCRFVLHCKKDWNFDGRFVRTLSILVLREIEIEKKFDLFFLISYHKNCIKKNPFNQKLKKAENLEHFPTFPGHAEKKPLKRLPLRPTFNHDLYSLFFFDIFKK